MGLEDGDDDQGDDVEADQRVEICLGGVVRHKLVGYVENPVAERGVENDLARRGDYQKYRAERTCK